MLLRAFVTFCLASIGVVVSSTAANADACSTSIGFLMPLATPGTYGIELANLTQTRVAGDFVVTLYSASASYELRLDGQLFDRRPKTAGPPMLSWVAAPAYFDVPGAAAIESAYVQPLEADGVQSTPCLFNHYRVRSRADIMSELYSQEPTLLDESDVAAANFSADSPITHATFRSQSPSPDCKQPYAEPRVLHAMSPPYPPSAIRDGASGMAMILLELDNAGKPLSAAVVKSANYDALDRAAEVAALTSSFAPQLFRCEPIGGSYVFRVDFSSNLSARH